MGKLDVQTLQAETLKASAGGHSVEIGVLPRMGANLTSLKVDGQEYIYFSKEKYVDEDCITGCFMMFPTPCRLTDATYTFGGKKVKQTKHDKDVFIHGLIRDEVFAVSRDKDSLTFSIEIDKKHPVYEGYPFPCRFSLKFSPLQRGVQIQFKYENTGTEASPFGFGLHAFWQIPNKREDVFVKVPCDQILELVNLIPTGNTSPVKGTKLDFREFTSLGGVDIDNAFWGRDPKGEHAIEYHDLGKKVTLESSEIFEHMIAYAPAGAPFVCMENLTCCPDAPNVFARGKEKVSGLKVVSPGQTLEGWVRYIVSDL